MILDEIVSWYQKKIGAYDKEPWENTVEQKIIDGFRNVTLKTAKLKTELIDVDLVRGSTFPKAKPKQSLLTVIRLAVLRCLFLPFYAEWWAEQTSSSAFALLLFLYATQIINWAVYIDFNTRHDVQEKHGEHVVIKTNKTQAPETIINGDKVIDAEHLVSISELLIPLVLSLLLSLIHSQIVATNIAQSCSKCKKRRYSNVKLRRRRKPVKLRNHDLLESSINKTAAAHKNFSTVDGDYHLSKSNSDNATIAAGTATVAKTNPGKWIFNTSTSTPNLLKSTTAISSSYISSKASLGKTTKSQQLKLDLDEVLCQRTKVEEDSLELDNDTECTIRKRNVNWHSPIHKYATTTTNAVVVATTQEKQQQTSPQSISTTSSTHTSQIGDNSSISSGSTNVSPTKTVCIDECVQEFYDDLINRTMEPTTTDSLDPTRFVREDIAGGSVLNERRTIGEDDGFESLNGKSSSGEETNASPHVTKNQLRLRVNSLNSHQRLQQLDEPLQSTTSNCYRRKINYAAGTTENSDYKATQSRSSQSGDLSSDETEEEGDDGELISNPSILQGNVSNHNECTTSATEWLGITTNSDECSYSSEYDNSDHYKSNQYSDENGCDFDFTPTTILNPHGTSDRISCTIWDQCEIKKAQMSVLEISLRIIENVESMPKTNDYIYLGIFFSFLLSLIPFFCRLCACVTIDADNPGEFNYFDLPMMLWQKASYSFMAIFRFAFSNVPWQRMVLVFSLIQRTCLTLILFMIFAVAERTFKQRFLYAKLFSHLTSSRRARKSNLPHFRLNKVRNIKTWLSVRSYLKKRGPQRSVDIIVSAAFIVTLLLLAFLSVEWLKDSEHLHSHLNIEALMWSTAIGIFLLRFMTLGNKIHHKYRSVSVLITEQINLYLQIEKKPKKKDELMVSNSVLKLASDLLKELETPFKISGLSANPYLFTTIKVVILSALSGVLSEMLGFKLKLHKIKIK